MLKRYIGEAISQQLMNRFEKLVITNQGKDWFKAVDYDKKESPIPFVFLRCCNEIDKNQWMLKI